MSRKRRSALTLVAASLLLLLLYSNCGGGSSSWFDNPTNTPLSVPTPTPSQTPTSTPTPTPTPSPSPSSTGVNNVTSIYVGCGYENEPCVDVTICIPGTAQCETITDVLLDTGSYGLRIFSSLNTLNLPMEADPNNAANVLAECVQYVSAPSDWGPVVTADVMIGGETAPSVPVQLINSGFGSVPKNCDNPATIPAYAGYNGVLGVGLFVQDCGTYCAPSQVTNNTLNGMYFSCPSSGTGSCSGATVALEQQVSNPVAYMPIDNNGVVVVLPSIPLGGVESLSGSLILGIGTQTNNTPASAAIFPADSSGNFTTIFNGFSYGSSFIDSGSVSLNFQGPASLTKCTTDIGFYCPATETAFSAIQQSGTTSQTISFHVANAESELAATNPNLIFPDLAGDVTQDFDWGLPFFFGRSVYVGIDQKMSVLGAGPFWAY